MDREGNRCKQMRKRETEKERVTDGESNMKKQTKTMKRREMAKGNRKSETERTSGWKRAREN